MTVRLPVKKSVSLHWRNRRFDFDVAQNLFSSFQVDRGSRMLLESLDPDAFPATGSAVDFGCGYGVLGVAWQVARPQWSMAYVDRDALAVAFSRHNAARTITDALPRTAFHTGITVPFRDGGHDLVLWNVPGKAGRPVIAALLDAALDALAPGGMLAAVVVDPLADLFTAEVSRLDAAIERVEQGKEHTVVHIRRTGGKPAARHPFAEGVFDREAAMFAAAGLEWTLVPAIGLPEYDSLGHATEVAARAMVDLRAEPIRSWLVIEPGAGHLAVVASRLWPEATGRVLSRDALALHVTERALAPSTATFGAIWDVPALTATDRADLTVMALPEQAQADELGAMLAVLEQVIPDGGFVVPHGRSVEIARVERLARKHDRWRPGRVEKLRGAACITLRVRL